MVRKLHLKENSNGGIVTLKNMNTDVIPVVDFGCYGGMLSDVLDDVFVYDAVNINAFDPSDEYYDEVAQLIADEYDGTDEFYNQVLSYAPSKIQEAFNEYGIPAQVVSGSCRWNHPRFYNYSDDCIEFDMTIDTGWVRAKFNEFSNDSKFRKFIDDTFSSRSGFISFMPDDVDSYSALLDSDSGEYWKVVSAIIQYIISEDVSIRNDITMDLVYDIEENADYVSMRSFM